MIGGGERGVSNKTTPHRAAAAARHAALLCARVARKGNIVGMMEALNDEKREKAAQKRRERKARQAGNARPEWKGFVSCELTVEDKKALREGAMSYEDAWEGLLDIIPEGYKLSISWDEKNDTFTASLTAGAGTGDNAGWCLTGRGASFDGAIISLGYKHFTKLRRDWSAGAAALGTAVVDFG